MVLTLLKAKERQKEVASVGGKEGKFEGNRRKLAEREWDHSFCRALFSYR